jgi:lipid A ethanolaminephosphotransferase
MALRLFHITEFAESRLLSPASQRNASPSFVVVLLFCLWLASICNLALWQALSRLPPTGAASTWWTGVVLGLMMTCALIMLLSFLSWRWTLKPALTLVLVLAAINAHLMLTQGAFINAESLSRIVSNPGVQLRAMLGWQVFAIVLLLGIAPSILLWRIPVRRTALSSKLLENIALFAVAGIILYGLWRLNRQSLLELINNHPSLRQLFNPFNMIQSLVQGLAPSAPSWLSLH